MPSHCANEEYQIINMAYKALHDLLAACQSSLKSECALTEWLCKGTEILSINLITTLRGGDSYCPRISDKELEKLSYVPKIIKKARETVAMSDSTEEIDIHSNPLLVGCLHDQSWKTFILTFPALVVFWSMTRRQKSTRGFLRRL